MMRCHAALVFPFVLALCETLLGCGGGGVRRWVQYPASMDVGDYDRGVASELRALQFRDEWYVREVFDADMHGGAGRSFVCREHVTASRDGDRVELVVRSLNDDGYRLFVWHDVVLVLETDEGRVYPYLPCDRGVACDGLAATLVTDVAVCE